MEYDFELWHIAGKKNRHMDMLSRCPDYETGEGDNKKLVVLPPSFFHWAYAYLTGSEWVDPTNKEEWEKFKATPEEPIESMHDTVEKDQQTKKSQEQLTKWANTHQLTKIGSVWWKNFQTVVASNNNLKRGVISLYHDKPSARHPGISNTYQLAKCSFWWPNMKQDVEQYVKGCMACQANKANTKLLKPAMIPITLEHTLPFQTVTVDFITKLPKSGKYNTIMTATCHD